MIDYLVPDFFIRPSMDGSGGMHTKVDRVSRAVRSIYALHVGSDLSKMQSEFLLIEPLYFRMSGVVREQSPAQSGSQSEGILEELRAHPAIKILYCSEMEVFRWTGEFRKALLEICDVVTSNSDYQTALLEAVIPPKEGVRSMLHRLIDPIPAAEFKPMPKKMQVVAMGRISEIKGSPFIAELFQKLAPLPIETVYVGGAALWGAASEVDLALEAEIREVADVFHGCLLPAYVPGAIGEASFFVANSFHDVFSSSHAEALMAGCLPICGAHPIYKERPGLVPVKDTDAAINLMKTLTEDFRTLPPRSMMEAARQWAVEHVSFEIFREQLVKLLKSFY